MTAPAAPMTAQPSLTGRRTMVAAAVMLALTMALWLARVHGLDYPAQLYRVWLVRHHGFSIWDANWYDGHYTPAYSVIMPWLAAVVGIPALAIASTVGSVVLYDRLLVHAQVPYPVAGTTAFAFLMLVNMYEGRLPFACGVLLGLMAVTFARNERWWLSMAASVLTALASPVAGAFLALACAAWAIAVPRKSWIELLRNRRLHLAAAPLLTAAAMNVLFHEGGMFPFNVYGMVVTVGSGVVAWYVVPKSFAAVRYGFVMAAVLAVPLMWIPNPMGGNLSRLAVIGAPILCAFPRKRFSVHAAVCLVLLVQQAQPLYRIPGTLEDPSSKQSYFQPLLDELQRRTSGPVRLEIPMTEHHWEAAYVAPKFPLARGWERQLDLRYNAVLYDADMNSFAYQNWLFDNGVSYIAVPDAPLEQDAEHEVAVVRSASFLNLVWHSEHWALYRVTGSPGLVSGPGHLIKMTADVVRLQVSKPESILLRMRYTPYLRIVHGKGCVSESPTGWTILQPTKAGMFKLDADLFPDHASTCEVEHD